MKKSVVKAKWLPWALGCGISAAVYLLASYLSACLILSGTIPENLGPACLCAAASAAAFFMGAICGRGESWIATGILSGIAVLFTVLTAKGICAQDAEWTVYTSAAAGCCMLFSVLGSCIFHKNNKKATKRKRRKTH